jgi:hypothetical protein
MPLGSISASDLAEQERAELDVVLASGALTRAPRQAKLLAYVCEEYFNGRGDQLKEYTLATEVLGRPGGFDQSRDAIVRVEIYRLRKKLREYYQSAGAAHSLHIVIQSGQYVPRFVRREESPYHLPENEPAPSDIAIVPLEPAEQETSEPVPAPASEPGPVSASWPRRQWIAIATGVFALMAVLVAGLLFLANRSKRAPDSPPAAVASPAGSELAPAAGSVDRIRIRAGYSNGDYDDRAGNVWQSDRYFSGGNAFSQPRQYIARTLDPAMFQAMRSGQFSYDIPLDPGNYELRLYFCETHYGPDTLSGGGETSRLFDVSMNGQSLLHIFDIIKDAGGNDTADVRVFKDVHPAADGKLHLRFQPLIDWPVLNAIEITPAPPGRINAIRIVAQENAYTDREGHVWEPDEYARGGQFAVHLHRYPVTGTPDPDLYVGERFGNFDYSIPVPPGRYAATLHFAETYWGLDNQRPGVALPDYGGSPEGGPGSRVFDVDMNGRTLLKDFDIFKEAGGAGRALVKIFHNLVPDGQGKLVFRFVPVRDYACVNAIEITDESP